MKIIGHRGARGLAPENTLAGIDKALEHRVDAIEIDVRVTGDDVVVLEHDRFAADASGSRTSVKATAYSELKRHKPDMPTLAEALDYLHGRVPLIIEIKPGEPVGPVIHVIRDAEKAGHGPGDISFISFDYRLLREIRAALPEYTVIMNERWSSLRLASRARRLGTKDVSMWQLVLWSGVVRGFSKRGYRLMTYTLNKPAKAAKWQRYGLGSVCTDYPDLFERRP